MKSMLFSDSTPNLYMWQYRYKHILLKDFLHYYVSCTTVYCITRVLVVLLVVLPTTTIYSSSGVMHHLFLPTGNGVVIHLPGLFEEAEKNLRKGKGVFKYSRNTNMLVVDMSLLVSETTNWNLNIFDSRSGGLGETSHHFWPRPYWYVQLLFLWIRHY